MNKPLQLTIFLDGLTKGSFVLKAPGQYYKIGGLITIVSLAAEVEQFIRSVSAGATPHSIFTLADMSGRKYDFELRLNGLVYLRLWLRIENAGRQLVFEWDGGFGDFRDGFKIF